LAFKYAEANRISIVITLNPIITFALLEILLFFHVTWIEITPFTVLAYVGAFLVIFGLCKIVLGNEKNEDQLLFFKPTAITAPMITRKAPT